MNKELKQASGKKKKKSDGSTIDTKFEINDGGVK